MLYDPKWEVQAKSDVFSLESLIAWLEKQPATKEYCFLDTGGCLHFQYLTAMGVDVLGIGGWTYRLKSDPATHISLPRGFGRIASGAPRTFGAALNRARKALAVA